MNQIINESYKGLLLVEAYTHRQQLVTLGETILAIFFFCVFQ